VSSVVERSVLGGRPLFDVPHGPGLQHASSLLLYAVLGLLSAGLSILFTDGLLKTRRRFQEMRRVPAWTRPALGALATGGLAVLALGWLGTGGVTGGGYDTLGAALNGRLAVRVLVPLCFMKLASTVLSYASGGAGGIFAPALFIGGMAGGAVGALDVLLFGHSSASMGAFALVGMGAVFAGIIRAPITSVLIIIEMTDGYALIVPLMIANMLAYGIARHLRPTPIYEALLEQDGIRLREETVAEHLGALTVADVPLDTGTFEAFQPETPLTELLQGLESPRRQEVFPVVREGSLAGIITLGDLMALANERNLEGLVNAADVMRPPLAVRPDERLRAAFEAMLAHGVRELPVTDGGGRILGFVDETSIAHAYASRRRER
jgi:CIC family chloride channel protein